MKVTSEIEEITFPVIFAGAGISFSSGLPLAKELKKNAFQILCNKCSWSFLKNKKNREGWEKKLDGIMLESVLEIFSKHLENISNDLANLFLGAKPTNYHYIIAELLALRKIPCLITTNFDDLIEKAYQEIQLKNKSFKELNVIFEETHTYDVNSPNLIKIHGCATSPSSLIFNLSHLGLGLERWKMELLKGLEKYNFLFLGYSDHDKDITPILGSLNNHWVWVLHNTIDIESQIPAKSNLAYFLSKEERVIVFCDAPLTFVKYVSSLLSKEYIVETNKLAFNWENTLKNIINGITDSKANLILGDIMYEIIGDFRTANIIFTKGSKLPDLTTEDKLMFHLKLNMIYGNSWDVISLEKNMNKLESTFDLSKMPLSIQALVKRHWATLFYKKSIEFSKKAEAKYLEEELIWTNANEQAEVGLAKMNQAVVLQKRGDYIKSKNQYEAALREIRNAGNILLLTKCLTNYGSLLGQRGQNELALKCYLEALELVNLLGDILWAARLKFNIGSFYREVGDKINALSYLKDALNIFNTFKDKYWIENVENELVYLES